MLIVNFFPSDPYLYPEAIETDQPEPTSEEEIFEEYFKKHSSMVGFEEDEGAEFYEEDPEEEFLDRGITDANRKIFREKYFSDYTMYEHFKWCYIIFGADSVDDINEILEQDDTGEYPISRMENEMERRGFYFIKLGRHNNAYLEKKMEFPELLSELLQSKVVIDYEGAIEYLMGKDPDAKSELERLGFDWQEAKKISRRARMLERE